MNEHTEQLFAESINRDDYKVDLGVFQGPMDLLLYLIKKEEVDIYDIPIAKITKQYLTYIDMMTQLNLEVAGDFILMAATLIRIKTKLLLPRDESNPDEVDPREELIMALVEYKKYKEGGEILRERALLEEQHYPISAPVTKIDGWVDLEPVSTIYDLMVAFKEVLTAKPEVTVHQVLLEEVSIQERMRAVLAYLKVNEFATFQQLFADIPRKIFAVVTFIALLELARSRRIAIYQSIPFAELRVYRGDMFNAEHTDVDLDDVTAIQEVKEDSHE